MPELDTRSPEVAQMRTRIRELDTTAATAREAADRLVVDMRSAGTDPLADADAFNRVDEAYKAADGPAQEAAELRARIAQLFEHSPRPPEDTLDRPRRGGFGERFIASATYRALADAGVFESSGSRVESAPVQVASREEAMAQLFLAAADLHGPLVPEHQELFPPVPLPARQVRLIDLITRATTDRELVEFTVQTTRSDAVAGVAYGTPAPQSNYLWERRAAPVRRRAHHAVATKGNLADQGELRSIIDDELLGGSRRDLENQILTGSGTGENFQGILNTAGISTVARNVAGNEPRHDAIHRGITAVRLALEDDITAVGLHPTPFEQLVLAKDTTGAYLHGPPPSAAQPRTVWGYPAVVSTAFPAGTAVVGNWPFAKLWMRTGVAVTASDSPQNFFLEGLVAILAELRAAFGTRQPKAFCTVTAL